MLTATFAMTMPTHTPPMASTRYPTMGPGGGGNTAARAGKKAMNAPDIDFFADKQRLMTDR